MFFQPQNRSGKILLHPQTKSPVGGRRRWLTPNYKTHIKSLFFCQKCPFILEGFLGGAITSLQVGIMDIKDSYVLPLAAKLYRFTG